MLTDWWTYSILFITISAFLDVLSFENGILYFTPIRHLCYLEVSMLSLSHAPSVCPSVSQSVWLPTLVYLSVCLSLHFKQSKMCISAFPLLNAAQLFIFSKHFCFFIAKMLVVMFYPSSSSMFIWNTWNISRMDSVFSTVIPETFICMKHHEFASGPDFQKFHAAKNSELKQYIST